METLRLKRESKLNLVINLLFFTVLSVEFLSTGFRGGRNIELIFGCVAFLVKIILDGIFTRTYVINFSKEYVEEKYKILFARSLKMDIDQIKAVNYAWDGRIIVEFYNGKFIKIMHRNIMGGIGEVVRVIKIYVPSELIDNVLLQKAKRVKVLEDQYYKGAYIIFSVLPVFVVITSLFHFASDGWHVFGRWGFDEVTGLSVKQNGAIWVATHNRGAAAKLHFYENETSTTYLVPGPVDDYAFSDVAIISDTENNPTILTRDVNYTLQNGVWEKWNFRTEQYQNFQINEFVNTENEIWMIVRSQGDNSIVHVLGGDRASTSIPFPNDGEDQKYAQALALSPNGVLAVLIADGKEQGIFLLEDGVWLPHSYPLKVDEAFNVQDIAIDASENVYALISSPFYEKVVIRKYNSTGSFETYFIEEKYGRSTYSDYDNLLVDSRSRLWLLSRFTDDGKILVLDPVWEGQANELVYYSHAISDYQMNMFVNKPQLTTDGRIWLVGANLAWIDTTADILPQPLPLILQHLVERKGAYYLGLLVLQLICIAYWYNKFANEFNQLTDKK
jgi:hypothetical protein